MCVTKLKNMALLRPGTAVYKTKHLCCTPADTWHGHTVQYVAEEFGQVRSPLVVSVCLCKLKLALIRSEHVNIYN